MLLRNELVSEFIGFRPVIQKLFNRPTGLRLKGEMLWRIGDGDDAVQMAEIVEESRGYLAILVTELHADVD